MIKRGCVYSSKHLSWLEFWDWPRLKYRIMQYGLSITRCLLNYQNLCGFGYLQLLLILALHVSNYWLWSHVQSWWKHETSWEIGEYYEAA